MFFFSLAVWGAVAFYSESERNNAGLVFKRGMLTADYATCVGLGTVSLSLLFRTFDHTTVIPSPKPKPKPHPELSTSALSTLPPGHIVRSQWPEPLSEPTPREMPMVVIERTYEVEEIYTEDKSSTDRLSTRTS